jgi:putative FmdB family regulatory protein
MYIIFEYQCRTCGLKFESLEDRDCFETACKECGSPANRVISAPRAKLDPISGDFPGATYKWERMHEQAGRKGRL